MEDRKSQRRSVRPEENGKQQDEDSPKQCRIDIVSLEVDWVNEVVYYNIRAELAEEAEVLYLSKRYSQFRALNRELKNIIPRYRLPPLPTKELVIWTDHTDTRFVEERRALLEHFLSEAVNIGEVREAAVMHEFLHSNEISANVARAIEEQFSSANENLQNVVEELEVAEIWVPSTKKMRDHCLYQIHCANGSVAERSEWNEWVVLKRYRDFYDMDHNLREELPSGVVKDLPVLPERQSKIMTDHMDPDFIDQRRILLQNYLQKLVRVPDVQHCQSFLKFVNVNAL